MVSKSALLRGPAIDELSETRSWGGIRNEGQHLSFKDSEATEEKGGEQTLSIKEVRNSEAGA